MRSSTELSTENVGKTKTANVNLRELAQASKTNSVHQISIMRAAFTLKTKRETKHLNKENGYKKAKQKQGVFA
ncbi:MAG: hypothetical protein V4623_02585 [Pseudomonadota bacterium]